MGRIAIIGGSFDPMTVGHHALVADTIKTTRFEKAIVIPCGYRPDKYTTNILPPVHRAAMVDQTCREFPRDRVQIDFTDLELDKFTPNHLLQTKYDHLGELWHVIGSDLIVGGANKESYIHRIWQHGHELWENLNFLIYVRTGYELDTRDLPPNKMVRRIDHVPEVSSSEVRDRVSKRQSITGLVLPQVEEYIHRRGLYSGATPASISYLKLEEPRLLIYADSYNAAAMEAADKFRRLESPNPNLVVVLGGDGTLLRASDRYAHLRIPMLGVHFGTVGYNLNHVRHLLTTDLFKQEMEVWHYPLLATEMVKPNGKVISKFAFNDSWVCAHTPNAGYVQVELSVDGKIKHDRIGGDGMLVSTPQGSTAYARSMGATPLMGDSKKFLVVGNNIYDPSGWKFSKLQPSSKVVVRNVGRGKLYGVIDGKPVDEVTEMRVKLSKYASVELAFFEGQTPRDKYESLQWASLLRK